MLRSFVENIGIRTKLILVFVLPIAALVLLSAIQGERMWTHAQNMRVAKDLIGVSLDISRLASELQKERGLSGGYIGSRGKQFRDQLRVQRQATDRTITSLSGFPEILPGSPDFASVKAGWGQILERLEQRPSIHQELDDFTPTSRYWSYYSGVIGSIISLIQQIPVSNEDPELLQSIRAYTILLWLEERSGQERGLMNRTITAGSFTPVSYRTISGYIAQQETLIEEFKLVATEEEWRTLNNVLTGPEGRLIAELRESITYRLAKSDLLNQLQSQIGYGGLIHHFKNYLLRGAERYRQLFRAKLEASQSITAEYRELPGVSVSEREAIGEIVRTLREYNDNLNVIASMRDAGETPLAIDKVVVIDDKPALDAVETLRRHIVPTDAERWFVVTTARLNQITAVRNDIKATAIDHMNEVTRQANLTLVLYGTGTFLVLSILVVLGSAISRRVSMGIAMISQTLKNVDTYGDYSEAVPLEGSDEIGIMSLHINSHLGVLKQIFDEVAAILEGAASSDFLQIGATDQPGDLGKLMQGVKTSTRKIEMVMEAQRQTAESLDLARNEAEQASRAKSDFLSSMSHELRTPLNAVLGFAQILELDKDNPLTLKQKGRLKEIAKAGQHLLELIDQVLSLSRIESGSLSIHIEPVLVTPIVKDCLVMARAVVDQNNVTIEDTVACETSQKVLGDPIRITQILMNLLSNAIKYSHSDGLVTLEVMEPSNKMMRFKVTDQGAGIDLEKQKDLFTPFNRLGQELTAIKGTGIGLTITQKLVEQMNGRIGFKSKQGQGSTFWVDLPIAAPETITEGIGRPLLEATPEIRPLQLQTKNGESYKVLYIEDNPANLSLMEQLIGTSTTLEMISARTAEIGLALAEKERPDLVLMDINLPGMNGDEAMKKLRQSDGMTNIPVIAISAKVMPGDIEKYMSMGFCDYLTKPFDVRQVLDAIKEVLDQPMVDTA